MKQREFLTNLCVNNPEATIIGSIGSISYDLTEITHPSKILIRGAMGAAIGCGIGLAMGYTANGSDKKVIVVVGDGSFLMKMGSLSTYLAYFPNNLKIIILNNNSYASCGGQGTNFRYIQGYISGAIEVHDIQ